MGKEDLWDFMIRNLKETIIDLIPVQSILSIRPKGFMYIFGAVSITSMTLLFGYNFITVYLDSLSDSFISLSGTSGDCEAVLKPVTGSFTADVNGDWEGFGGFTYSGANYNLILTGAEMSFEQYQDVIVVFRDQLAGLGELAVNMDLSANLALIMSWAMICDPDIYPVCSRMDEQYFVFTGSSQYIFLSSDVHPSFSYIGGDCFTKSTARYDLPSAQQISSFDAGEFSITEECRKSVDLSHIRPIPANNIQKIAVDMRTFGDAVGISMGFLALAGIETVPGAPDENLEIHHNGHTYIGNYYIDSYYVGMEAIYCLLNTKMGDLANENPPIASLTPDRRGVVQICFIPIGKLMTVPLLNHYGTSGNDGSFNSPSPCDCSKPEGNSDECDLFNLMSTFVFFDEPGLAPPAATKQILRLLDMVVANGGYNFISARAYNASFASAAVARGQGNVDPIVNSSAWRESAYSFCNYSCSVLVVNSFGDALEDSAMTEFMFQMVNGSCSDIYSMSDETFQTLQATAPTAITERYLQCKMKTEDAFNDALGIAAGNAATVVPVIFLMILPIFYFLETFFGVDLNGRGEFSDHDIEETLSELMVLLLRVEDHKLRSMQDENGPVRVLARELEDFVEERHTERVLADLKRKRKENKEVELEVLEDDHSDE